MRDIITSSSYLWRLAVHRLVTGDVINIYIYIYIYILRYKGYSPLLLTLFREVIFIYGQSHPKYGRWSVPRDVEFLRVVAGGKYSYRCF